MLQFEWWRRRLIIAAALLVAAGALAGCSALGMVYKQADGLIYWWLDGYFDFTEPQAARSREAVARLIAWHRREQLPDYVALAERAATEVLQDVKPAQVCQWYADLGTRLEVLVERALPEATAIVASFGPEQLTQLERKQAKNNTEYRDDFLQRDLKERRAAAVERAVERAEQLYGRLGDAQKAAVAQGVSASPFEPERWLVERKRRQRDLLTTLRGLRGTDPELDRDAAVRALRGYWERVKDSPDAAYARYQRRLQAYNCEFAVQVHNATTPEQRQAAQRRLRGWETDLRRLITPPV